MNIPWKKFTILSLGLLALSLPGSIAHAQVSGWLKGANIKPFSTTDFASQEMKSSLDALKNTGANYAVLIIPYYQANRQSTEMRPGWNTPTDEALASAIDYAHSIGLKVMINPHLETDYIEWRGNIDPAKEDRPAWFASYTNMLVHYGTIAQAHGVEDYAIGAELLHMTNPYYDSENTNHWKAAIAEVRKIFHGRVTYSANRDFEVDVVGFWDDLDYIGLSAYYDLYHAQNNSVDELKKSWENWRSGVIEPIHNQFNKDIVITEIGYRSIDNAYRDPWDWGRGGNYNEQDQANSYDALMSYWNDVSWMKGVVIWRWEITPPGPNSGNTDYTPQNKLAESIMKKWFGGSNTGSGGSGNGGSNNSGGTGNDGTGNTGSSTDPGTGNTGNTGGNTGTGGSSDGSSNNGGIQLSPESALDIWWPTNGSSVSGLQPFKAMVTYSDVSTYNMYWQVDNDRLNIMYDSSTDYPHKEAMVDLTNWNWRESGQYNINFVVQDKSGQTIFQKSVGLNVTH